LFFAECAVMMKIITTKTYSFDHTISICDILTAVNVN
jgi:hypothetical protein